MQYSIHKLIRLLIICAVLNGDFFRSLQHKKCGMVLAQDDKEDKEDKEDIEPDEEPPPDEPEDSQAGEEDQQSPPEDTESIATVPPTQSPTASTSSDTAIPVENDTETGADELPVAIDTGSPTVAPSPVTSPPPTPPTSDAQTDGDTEPEETVPVTPPPTPDPTTEPASEPITETPLPTPNTIDSSTTSDPQDDSDTNLLQAPLPEIVVDFIVDATSIPEDVSTLKVFLQEFVIDLLTASRVVSSTSLNSTDVTISMEPAPESTEADEAISRGSAGSVPMRLIIDGIVYFNPQTSQEEILQESMSHSIYVYFSLWGTNGLETELEKNGFINPQIFSILVDGREVLMTEDGNSIANVEDLDSSPSYANIRGSKRYGINQWDQTILIMSSSLTTLLVVRLIAFDNA